MTIKPIVDEMKNRLHEMPGEDMSIYPVEREYLEQENNSVRYYIPGKAVCITDSGSVLWYDLPLEEIGLFNFDETVLNEFLKGDFTNAEMKAIEITSHLDEQAREIYLHVVWMIDEGGDKQSVMFYSSSSEAYFKVPIEDVDNVNLITANIMAQQEPGFMIDAYNGAASRVDSRGVITI